MSSSDASSITDGPVDRAFHLLQVVVNAGEPLGVRELGRRTGLPRSTASRLVATLERLRMVDRTAAGEVIPGSALATLHTDTTSSSLLRDRLHPLLTELVQQYGENAALSIDDGNALLYVSIVLGDHPVSVSSVAGERHAFHLVAPGLIDMAGWPKERLREYFRTPLERATTHSVTSRPAIQARLKQIAADGYAWTDQELDVGINGVAIRVSIDGASSAAISLYGPSYRFSPEELPTLGDELRDIVGTRIGTLSS